MKHLIAAMVFAASAGQAVAFDLGNGLSITPSAVIAWDVENEVPAHAVKLTGGYFFESGASLSLVAEYDVQDRGTTLKAKFLLPVTPNIMGFSSAAIDFDADRIRWIVGMEIGL